MQGALKKLRIERGDPARYELAVGGDTLALNPLLGSGLEIVFSGAKFCSNPDCGEPTTKTFGGGYCYDCFSSLARADLCFVAPQRCHFDAGTCREPDWGQAVCMQGHVVYLANSAGLKVGITRTGRQVGRWLDQGAVQGIVICHTDTRRDAGIIEAALARSMSDRTDWRRLVSADAPLLDLAAEADRVRRSFELPVGSWVVSEVNQLSYPIQRYGRVEQLRLSSEDRTICSTLLGCKGSYLLFEHGVFNVSAHSGFEVSVRVVDNPPDAPGNTQLDLF